jgi:hypothetical protein
MTGSEVISLPHTRFSGLSPVAAGSVLIGLLLLIVSGFLGGVVSTPAVTRGGHGDQALYVRVIDDVARGQSYYSSVVTEYRRGHYPLKPAVAVRNPLLATAMAALPNDAMRTLALRVLVIAVIVAWGWRLHLLFGRPVLVGVGLLLMSSGLLPSMAAGAYAFHEIWAGALIALSLAVHDPRRWWPSVVIGLLAVVVRELALPYLLVMGVFALIEGHRREASAWTVAVIVFFGILACHAHLLAAYLSTGDPASPGWLGFGGWAFVLSNAKWNALLILTPPWLSAVIVPIMLLGLASWPGPLGLRLAATCFGYNLAFLVVGRPDNFYWGLIVAPLMALGLLLAPGTFRELFVALRSDSR